LARRKKKGNTGGELLVQAFVALFALLAMIGSFILFVAWLYFERKAKYLPKPTSIHEFDHTSEEISQINYQEDSLNEIHQRLDQISYEGQSLTKRQDGMYNERSKKGKQFNAEICKLNPKADNLEQSLADLEALPEKRLNHWAFYASMHLALRKSVVSYIISFAIFAWLQPKWVMKLSQFMQKFSFLDFYASYPIAYGASVGSLVISLLVLGVAFFYLRSEKKEALLRNS